MMDDSLIRNEVCGDAQPKLVLHFFEEICKIPHGSFHVQELSDWLVSFAKDRKLAYTQDKAGNVIIWKDATEGASSDRPVILQGHIDMVLEKRDDCPLDLLKQHIQLKKEGDLLYAEGTTLGGDDGIAVAMMLALLEDDTIAHPPLECVFTVNEEVGLLGAEALDVSELKGRRMINLDSEDEGIFTVGCAGGAEEHCTFPIVRKEHCGMIMQIEISGLLGGHSGGCIHMGRANADILMGRVLYKLAGKMSVRLLSIEGGSKDNAIPRNCCAKLLVDSDVDQKAALHIVEKQMDQISEEYRLTDGGITFRVSWEDATEIPVKVLGKADTKKIIDFLMLTPNGLIERDPVDRELPQTSLNLGILNSSEDKITAVYLVRSSVNSQKKYLQKKVETLVELLGGTTEVKGAYPAWERAASSPLCDELSAIYERLAGKKPVISVIHGGLECGLIAAAIGELDCVSIGPDMEGIHTPDEKLSIASTERTWNFLLEALKEI